MNLLIQTLTDCFFPYALQYVEDPARFPDLNPINLLEQTMCGLSHLHSLNIGVTYTHAHTWTHIVDVTIAV